MKNFSIYQSESTFRIYFLEQTLETWFYFKKGSDSSNWSSTWRIVDYNIPGTSTTLLYRRVRTSTSEMFYRYAIADCNKIPKLIKIYCPQLDESGALTSSSKHLLAILPYRDSKYYNHTASTLTPLKLQPRLSKISFKITDELDRQLDLLTGLASFVHFFADPAVITMSHAACYFSSGDPESLSRYPSNRQNAFRQVLSSSIDSRGEILYASLQSVYIPRGVFNVSPEYTRFNIIYDSNDKKAPNSRTIVIPENFYTQYSFIGRYNINLRREDIELRMRVGRICVYNRGSASVTLVLPPQLAYMLGAVNHISVDDSRVTVPSNDYTLLNHRLKFDVIRVRIIKIMCNILSPSLFGGKHQKILRVVDLDEQDLRDDVEKGCLLTFSSLHTVKVREGIYNEIEISLLDENNSPIIFEDRQVSVEGLISIHKA